MSQVAVNGKGVGGKGKTEKGKGKETELPTVRLELELEKTSKDSFPEFSYLSLKKELNHNIDAAEKENRDTNTDKSKNDLQDLASYFEKKYGNFGNTAKFDKKKRRRHERIEDFMDMGEGYDAEDDFIDDSAARDIFVPQEYDTWHGGFYVNQGKLRFKMSDETDEEVSLMTGTKKRNLGLQSISDEETADSEEEVQKEKPMKKLPEKPAAQSAAQKIIAKAKKTQKVIQKPPAPKLPTPKPVEIVKLDEPVGSSTPKVGKVKPRSPAKTDSKSDDKKEPTKEEDDNLPADLDKDLREKCENLRAIAEAQKGISSQRFFTTAINQMLMDVENLAVSVPSKKRHHIYSYLVKPMPCTKDTLVARLKKLKKEKLDAGLREPFAALVLLVTKSMSAQTIRWEQLRLQYEKRQKEFAEKSATDPNLKKPRQPGKIFSWDAETKEAFNKLITIKRDSYAISRPRGITQDEWLKQYLEEEVKGIWPTGWMTVKNLEKLIKPASAPVSSGTNGAPKAEPAKSPVKPPTKSPTATITAVKPPPAKSVAAKPAAPKSAAPKPAAETSIGQKRKLSDNSAQNSSSAAKKKTPKETTAPSTPFTIKDLTACTVNLVQAQIPPGTAVPASMALKKPTKAPPASLPASLPAPPKTVSHSAISSELEKLKSLKQIIHSQSPKEDGRGAAVKTEKPVHASSPVIEPGRACGVIRSAPVPPRVPNSTNFSVSQLTSPVKSSPVKREPHIPVIINNHARAVSIEVKPEVKSVTRALNRPHVLTGSGGPFHHQVAPHQPHSSFLPSATSPSSSSSLSVSQSAHSVSKLFNSVSNADLLLAATAAAAANQGLYMSPPAAATSRPKQNSLQKNSSPQKTYPIYNHQLVSQTNAPTSWLPIGSAQNAANTVCMVKNVHGQVNPTLYAVPISSATAVPSAISQTAALSADLNAIEPTLPIDSNMLYKQSHLGTQGYVFPSQSLTPQQQQQLQQQARQQQHQRNNFF